MRKILVQQGIDQNINSPRSVFTHAYTAGLINDLPAWTNFIEKRNLTVQTYDGQLADIIFESLPTFAEHLNVFITNTKRL